MHFHIAADRQNFPTLIYGQAGRELSAFIPDSVIWSQLNYGQGEGQVLYLGCEWGFYVNEAGIDIHIHNGCTSLENSLSFVHLVQEHVFTRHGISSNISLEADGESA